MLDSIVRDSARSWGCVVVKLVSLVPYILPFIWLFHAKEPGCPCHKKPRPCRLWYPISLRHAAPHHGVWPLTTTIVYPNDNCVPQRQLCTPTTIQLAATPPATPPATPSGGACPEVECARRSISWASRSVAPLYSTLRLQTVVSTVSRTDGSRSTVMLAGSCSSFKSIYSKHIRISTRL